MARNKFYQFFPPPLYLKMPAVGLDISDVSLRFAELVEKGKELQIGHFGERAIPRGIIEQGEVKKPAELRAIFSEIKQAYGLEFAAVALPEERAYLFDLELPVMKPGELRGAIELVLEEHVPIKASEALFDYDVEEEAGASIRVNVSAVSRALVDGYLEAFSGSGITPVAFEVEAQSLVRAVIPFGDMRSSMIVDLGKTRTGVAIASYGRAEFSSTVPIGGIALTGAIAKELNISYDEAEKVKREKGLLGTGGGEGFAPALSPIISALRDEIRRSYSYWQTHTDSYGRKRKNIEKIYLCGGDANLPGFSEYLATGLDAPVSLANVFVNVNTLTAYVPEISFSDSLRYATAIGLALNYR